MISRGEIRHPDPPVAVDLALDLRDMPLITLSLTCLLVAVSGPVDHDRLGALVHEAIVRGGRHASSGFFARVVPGGP